MEDFDEGEDRFDVDQYLQSQIELRTLKARLPERSVESLAREVLRRIAARAVDLPAQTPEGEDLEALCNALLSEDDQAGAQFIKGLRADGASVEVVYLTYLAGAARLLGDWWNSDRLSFTDVTLGTSRMYAIMRALRHHFAGQHVGTTRSAVFASVPGDTHVLGVRMAADLFRKAGWDIDLKLDKSHDELVEDLSASHAIIIGLSAGGNRSIEPLSKLIIALRISNPRARIFVSGQIVEEARDEIDLMDIDGAVTEVDEALQLLAEVWDQATGSR
ncbi:cobalamin B12-binding domain-containing protein [Gymnodinialimonas sp.]